MSGGYQPHAASLPSHYSVQAAGQHQPASSGGQCTGTSTQDQISQFAPFALPPPRELVTKDGVVCNSGKH